MLRKLLKYVFKEAIGLSVCLQRPFAENNIYKIQLYAYLMFHTDIAITVGVTIGTWKKGFV